LSSLVKKVVKKRQYMRFHPYSAR